MGGPAMLELDREIDFQIPIKVDLEKQTPEGNFFFRALATTTDIDLAADVITEEALETAKDDLLKNPTIFLDHDRNIRVGTVVDTEYDKEQKAIIITGQILNSRPDIKEEIIKGSLSKISISARVMNAHRELDERTGTKILKITRMRLKDSSLVGMPANQDARTLEFWIEKSHKTIPLKMDSKFGSRMLRLREERGWTAKQLGDRSGVDASTILDMETNEIHSMSVSPIRSIAKAFDITLRKFVADTGLATVLDIDLNEEDENMGKESATLDKKDVESKKDETTPEVKADETKAPTFDLQKSLETVATEVAGQHQHGTAAAQMKMMINHLLESATELTKPVLEKMDEVFGVMVGAVQKSEPSDSDKKFDSLITRLGEVLNTASPKTIETDPKKAEVKDPKDIQKSEKPIPRVIRKGEGERQDVDIDKEDAIRGLAKTTKEGQSPSEGIRELVKAGLL